MGSCIIFCAGEFNGLVAPTEQTDYILAADGGLLHLQTLGLTPDGVLGDFDSLGYVPESAKVFPVEKDETDAVLAVRQGLALGFRRFLLYGSLDGPRLDHTVANFQTLQFLADRGAVGYLIGTRQIATVVKNGQIRFSQEAEGILSVFCLGADATGVTLEGLKYPMQDGCLSTDFPLGVSNHFVGKEAAVSVKEGSLLLLFEKENWERIYEHKHNPDPGAAGSAHI